MSLDFGIILSLHAFGALQSLGQLVLLPSLTLLLLGVWTSSFEVLKIRHLFRRLPVASCSFFSRWCDPILCIHILVWFLCRLCTVVMLDVVIGLDVELTCCKLGFIFFFGYLFDVGCKAWIFIDDYS